MHKYDETLHNLQAQCARKKRLEAELTELRTQQADYAARVRALEETFQEEQADVERLERRSLSALFYQAIGKMEEKLTKEQREAYAARMKYQAAAAELSGIEADLRRCQAELQALQGCEGQYAALLEKKTRAVKAAGGTAAAEILRLEARLAYLDSQTRELQEAMAAGQDALGTTDQILESLNSAEGWGTWDLVGGGLLTDLMKHGHLDDAQDAVSQLQSQLRRFKTELADVTIRADFQVNIDGFLRMADYFFDGIFADWAVLDRIQNSQAQVQETRNQIGRVLDYLRTQMDAAAAEQSELRASLAQLVTSVPL